MTEYLIRYCELIFNSSVDSSDKLMSESLGNVGLAATTKGHTLPAQMRPKSLAISTPTKLLSLEEARSKHGGNPQLPSGGVCLNSSNPLPVQASQKFIEVGGGPDKVPTKYHTVIDLPSMAARPRSHFTTFLLFPRTKNLSFSSRDGH